MDKKRNRADKIKILLLLGGAIMTALNWVLGFFPLPIYQSRLAGIFLFIIIVFAVLLWHVIDVQRENSSIKNTRPNIDVDGFEAEEFQSYIRTYQKTKDKNVDVIISRSFVHGDSEGDYNLARIPIPRSNIKITSKPDKVYIRYYIRLKNIKTEGVNLVDTEPLHAELEYYDWDMKQIFRHEEPFWQDHPRNIQPQLLANGKPEKLCLVIHEKNDTNLYAFASKMSYPENSLAPVNEKLFLGEGIIHLKITLYAQNITNLPSIWVELISDKNNYMTMDVITDPKLWHKTSS